MSGPESAHRVLEASLSPMVTGGMRGVGPHEWVRFAGCCSLQPCTHCHCLHSSDWPPGPVPLLPPLPLAAGKIRRVEIKKSYAFVQFETLEDAEYALRKANGSMLDGRTLAVRHSLRAGEEESRGGGDRDRVRGALEGGSTEAMWL